MKKENKLSSKIIGAAVEVHKHLGPGLLESIYEEAMSQELMNQGIFFQRQVPVPIIYKGIRLSCDYRLDFLVDKRVIVELKTVERFLQIHEAQALTYLRVTGCRLCLLINFNVPILINGIKRIVLNL